MDIDEELYRKGHVEPRLYGYLKIPFERDLVQSRKSPSRYREEDVLKAIALDIIDRMSDEIIYIINWDDGNTTETECTSPNSSIELCYTYPEKGYYNIKAKAKECSMGQESDWTDPFLFIVPRERNTMSSMFQKILQRFIYFFPFLERLVI